jgi:outer membrane immunogenic protein
MLKFTATAACVLILAAASQAAEILAFPTDTMVIRAGIDETPAPTAASPDRWTGAYAGIAAGYGMLWDSQNATANGADFGGFAGYNIRVSGPVVGGLEAEYMHINREFSDNIGVIANETFTAKARLGYEHGRFLAYALAGAQHATSKVPFAHVPGLRSVDTTYVLGAGLDVAVTDRISLGAEYTRAFYKDFDKATLGFPLDVRVQRINARVSYKIN